MKKKVFWVALLLLAGGLLIGLILYIARIKGAATNMQLVIETTDAARYNPGDTVHIKAFVAAIREENSGEENSGEENSGEKKLPDDLRILTQVYHLGEMIFSEEQEVQQTEASSDLEEKLFFEVTWSTPLQDYTGYLVELTLLDKKGRTLSLDTIGVDVSSDWVKFPRYGYVCDFEENEDTEDKIEKMNRFHINAIEFYDWHALHHEPVPEEVTRENLIDWQDWAGRTISGRTVESYLEQAHEKNMIGMAYNMIYAGTDTFFQDEEGNPTPAARWQIQFAPQNSGGEGVFTFRMGTSPSGNGNLYFVNPLNQEWQDYIFAQENHIFEVLDFDGWHGDTVGDWGAMTDMDGNPLGYDEDGNPVYYVKDTYRSFLNAAKEALGNHYLSFNPVGAQGIEQANTSRADVLYTEFWPWDADRNGIAYDTYGAIAGEVERTMEESAPYSIDGSGKSLVVKAYINYYKTNGFMNAPGVLLMDAAVYAAGGSRLEIGNGDHMLHVEYYPDDEIPMDEELTEAMKRMADFTVAYENLLRDGQKTVKHNVSIDGYNSSATGEADAVWCYTREDADYEILHLINLLETDNEWRDERGKKNAPPEIENFSVKYYTDKEISEVYLASPDLEDCRPIELSFKEGQDESGTYISFSLPLLRYWDMIFMK